MPSIKIQNTTNDPGNYIIYIYGAEFVFLILDFEISIFIIVYKSIYYGDTGLNCRRLRSDTSYSVWSG